MKKLLIVLILTPLISNARGFYLGAKVGFNIPTTRSFVYEKSSILFGGKVFLSSKKGEAGIDFEVGNYQARGLFVKPSTTAVHATGVYNILQLFANYKIITKQDFDFYSGLSLGVDFGEVGDRSAVIVDKNTGRRIIPHDVNTFNNALCMGLQAGVRYYVIKAISLQLEVAGRTSFLNDGHGFSYAPLYFPVSLGVNVRLFKF